MQEILETRIWSLGWEEPIKEGMAAHSSVLAQRIPWTEKPGRLWSIRSQRDRHNWSDFTCMHLFKTLPRYGHIRGKGFRKLIWVKRKWKCCSFVSDSLRPRGLSPPCSSVRGILQARILEWVAISFSRGSSRPRDQTASLASPALVGRFFTTVPPGTPHICIPREHNVYREQQRCICWIPLLVKILKTKTNLTFSPPPLKSTSQCLKMTETRLLSLKRNLFMVNITDN